MAERAALGLPFNQHSAFNIQQFKIPPGVLVAGMDPESQSVDSIEGASWVFALASLDRLGAFLAVRTIPQRRLDAGYYMRQVKIDEV
jgi:hypothetical protein